MAAKPLLALAAFSLAATGTAASAQSAAPLSVANAPLVRQGADPDEAAELRGTILPVAIAVLVVVMLAFVIKELGDDNELPGSP